jgi:Glycosyltransferase family 87
LGILWTLSDYVFEHRRYSSLGYYFPPPNAILVHAYGFIDRELAFRLYVLIQVACFVLLLWMWSRWLGLGRRPDRLVVVLAAVLASLRYIHTEFAMHNLNLLSLVLVSAAVIFHRNRLAGFLYALSLAIKPYSSVLVLPWMIWRGHLRWTAHAAFWLLIFFLVVPDLFFGIADAGALYRDWIEALTTASAGHVSGLSVKAGLAALLDRPLTDTLVVNANTVALGLWILVVAAFFAPTLVRKAPPSQFAAAAELAAILLVALPVGALQQPARGVALLTAMLVIAAAAFADARSSWSRIALFAVLAFVGISSQVVPMGPLFALLTLPICIAALAGLAIARRQPKLGKPASRDLAALRCKALRKLGSFCQNQEKLGSFCQKSLELLGL